MKKIASALLLSAAISAPAFAADVGTFYGAIDYGTWSMSPSGGSDPGAFSISGGYRFMPNVAVEVGYSMVGDITFSGTSLTYAQSAFKGAAVGTYAINNQFDVFGKLGLAMVSGELSCTGCTTSSATTSSLMYGIGGQYNISKEVGVRLQYESLGKSKGSSSATGVDVAVTSIGVVYNF